MYFSDLLDSTERFDSNRLRNTSVNLLDNNPTDTGVLYRFDSVSESTGKHYETWINFLSESITLGKNETISLRDTSVEVNCGCSDYYFTFAYPNYTHKCNYGGEPKEYFRKTTNRKPRNPEQRVGICKHIYSAYLVLKRRGIVK